MSAFAFAVLGQPAPQGSKRHVGKGVMIESSKAVRPWRESVKLAAPAVRRPLDGPLVVAMIFTLRRPASAKKTDTHPYRIPDLSKLCRSTEDAITEAGCWADDARVVEYLFLRKCWWGYDNLALPVPGAVIGATEIYSDPSADRLHELLKTACVDMIRRTRGVDFRPVDLAGSLL